LLGIPSSLLNEERFGFAMRIERKSGRDDRPLAEARVTRSVCF
jgi:hypothetical protein